ncbi:unnamed protein product [Didymodactylos carnosus]|uniref:Uncharacterized protein n=1 Tax=Didymodactylos carnosus TaxID=1234261 RepID=A0A813VFC9_9BILA|nr:unnamed protein product [Didymodactylos carnosus]CAF0837617.1 unnamed protein product [Didymodactylos carnosus]CAF3508219.1 unnamed protein product [Didymodactylos carnosus]CAF3624871.1 unnamed protein product [Didymodactylos carnosus]
MTVNFEFITMAWVDKMIPIKCFLNNIMISEREEDFESWRKEFQQERLLRIVREREIMKETAKRCKAYQYREQEANEAIERRRQSILAQRKAATVQATMRFQRGLQGFTVMDPDKFEKAIETITGNKASSRSTPRQRRNQNKLSSSPATFRRSISMEELYTRQHQSQQQINTTNPHAHRTDYNNNQPHLTRTNSATYFPHDKEFQNNNAIQYTSPLHEVQRKVLTDFAAQVQSTFHNGSSEQHQKIYQTPSVRQITTVASNNGRRSDFDQTTWENESMDSLENENRLYPQLIENNHQRIPGPIVKTSNVLNVLTKQQQLNMAPLKHSIQPQSTKEDADTAAALRRSYHESFFVKNTPVTADEQVKAWLGATTNGTVTNNTNTKAKTSSLDGGDSIRSANGRLRSILKRSPSVDSTNDLECVVLQTKRVPNTKTSHVSRSSSSNQHALGDKVRLKDSLEVINTKLLKGLDTKNNSLDKKKTVRFAQEALLSERCASDTLLMRQMDYFDDDTHTPIRRVQSAGIGASSSHRNKTFPLKDDRVRPAALKQTQQQHVNDNQAARAVDQRLETGSQYSESSSHASSKPPIHPSTLNRGYYGIGMKQRELRTKLHKTRYAQALRQTNSPFYDNHTNSQTSPSMTRRTSENGNDPSETTHNENKMNNIPSANSKHMMDDENDSVFSELRVCMSSTAIPDYSNNAKNTHELTTNGNNRKQIYPAPQQTMPIQSKVLEDKLNGSSRSKNQTPLGLSAEEKRIQQSLDRLDLQLKRTLVIEFHLYMLLSCVFLFSEVQTKTKSQKTHKR